MKLRTLTAVAVLAFTVAAPAFASDGRISVSLQTPLAAKTKVVAGGAVFSCADAVCVAYGAPARALSASACKAVAREVGAVSAYASDRKALQADDLARCNATAN